MNRSCAGELPVGLADMRAADWAAAIVVRHSSRTYTGRVVEPAVLGRMEELCAGLPGPEVARVALVREVPDTVFTGFVGSYGRVLGSPSALMMIGREDEWAVQESVGYLGEAAILEATSLGLDTCWIAGSFDRALASALLPLVPGEKVYAISPLGFAQPRPRAGERVMKRLVGAHKRRPIEDVAPGFDPDTWPAWAAEGVRLARVAPSAINREPWRFDFEADTTAAGIAAETAEPTGTLTVSVSGKGNGGTVHRRLDCGIAMLHFEVGARLMGAPGRWEIMDAPLVARYRVAAAARDRAC